jgi:hypothetical protein
VNRPCLGTCGRRRRTATPPRGVQSGSAPGRHNHGNELHRTDPAAESPLSLADAGSGRQPCDLVADELWISGVALLLSGASAIAAGLSYRLASQTRRDTSSAEVAAFRAAIKRKAALKAPDAVWSVGGVHDSVYRLVDDLTPRIGKLPKVMIPTGEAAVEASADALNRLRRWAIEEPDEARTDIHEIPEALAVVEEWVATMRGHLAVLERYDERASQIKRGRTR